MNCMRKLEFFLTFATQIYGLIAEYALSLFSDENIKYERLQKSSRIQRRNAISGSVFSSEDGKSGILNPQKPNPNLRMIAFIAHFTGWIT